MEGSFDIILGILISLIGLLLIIYGARNKPAKSSYSESTKSTHIQALILGIALLIGGLLYAF